MSDEILDMMAGDEDNKIELAGEENQESSEESNDEIIEDGDEDEESSEEEGDENPLEGDEESSEEESSEESPLNLSEHLGEEYDSIDKVKDTVAKYKESASVIQTLNKEKEELAAKIAELASRQPFKDKRFYQLDKLSEKDPERAKLLQGHMFGNLSNEQVVKLKMKLDNPEAFEKNPGYLERKFQKQYPSLFDEDIDKDDPEYIDTVTELELDAKKLRDDIQKEIDQVEVPETKVQTPEEIEKEKTDFIKSWSDGFKKVSETLTKIDLPVLDEKGKTSQVFSSLEFSENEVKDLKLTAANFILDNSLEPNEANIKQAGEVAKAKYIVENFAKINTYMVNKIASKEGQKWLKNVSNASKNTPDAKKKGKTASNTGEDSAQAAFDEITSGFHI